VKWPARHNNSRRAINKQDGNRKEKIMRGDKEQIDEGRKKRRFDVTEPLIMDSFLQIAHNIVPRDIIMHICSFCDVKSILSLGATSKAFHSVVDRFSHSDYTKRDPTWIFPHAFQEYKEIFNAFPVESDFNSRGNHKFHVYRLSLFHEIVKLALEEVNKYKRTSLRIITGEDLLYSVGRLSMMITHADFAPSETGALPVNWTSYKHLLKRIQRVSGASAPHYEIVDAAKRILNNVKMEEFGLLAVEKYEHPHTLMKRTLLMETLAPILPALSVWFESMTDKQLMALAKEDKVFLALSGFTPAPHSFQESTRRKLIAELVLNVALSLKEGSLRFSDILNREAVTKLLTYEQEDTAYEDLKQIIYSVNGGGEPFQYGMYLPWGNNQVVPIVNKCYKGEKSSIRLIFSQGLHILRDVIGSDGEAADLSYEHIVEYLRSHSKEQIEMAVKNAFLDLTAVNNAFVGELAILLVGIEGSQNNLTVLHSPMVMDLVRDGKLTWRQAFFTGNEDIPFFAMAAHHGAKGDNPMTKHSNLILRDFYGDDKIDVGFTEQFWNFLSMEVELHELFLKTYWPQLGRYEEQDQLILSTLIIKNYLLDTFFADPQAAASRINGQVAELLTSRFKKGEK
jgi:hypothetical protein